MKRDDDLIPVFKKKKNNKKLAFTNYYGKPTRMIIIMAVNAEHDIQSN